MTNIFRTAIPLAVPAECAGAQTISFSVLPLKRTFVEGDPVLVGILTHHGSFRLPRGVNGICYGMGTFCEQAKRR